MNLYKQNYLIVLLNIINLIVFTLILYNNGDFVYALDDPYIHLSIANNFNEFGVWGINQFYPAPSSSSPLFTFLLIFIDFIFSLNNYTILIINILVFNLILFISKNIAKEFNFNNNSALCFIFLIYFLTPLFANIVNGMEHLIQILANLLLVYSLIKEKNKLLYLSAFISATIRYEGLFLIIAVCLILLFQKEYRKIIIISFLSLIPLLLIGYFFYTFSGSFLPNSVILKGAKSENGNEIIFYLTNWLNVLINKKQMIPVFLTSLFLIIYSFKNKFNIKYKYVSIILFITILLHLSFAQIGWFFRYEAYLIAILVFVTMLFNNEKKYNKVIIVILLIVNLPLAIRAFSSFYRSVKMPETIKNVHLSQAEYLRDSIIIENNKLIAGDIGAISFYTNLEIIDLNGLGNNEVRDAYLKQRVDSVYVNNLINRKNIKYALFYKDWEKYLPNNSVIIKKWKHYNYSTKKDLEINLYEFQK